jgi:hypothetical protein
MKTIALVIFFIVFGITSYPQTYVSGGIYTNTTWTPANSPYIVTGDVAVFETFTLTILPGVEVRFYDGTMLDIRGTLISNGTSSDSIKFTSNSASPSLVSWDYIQLEYQSNMSMRYCLIEYSSKGIFYANGGFTTYLISNCRFSSNGKGISGDRLYGRQNVDSCLFQNNNYGILATFLEVNRFNHCSFINNHYGIAEASYDTIKDCDFQYNSVEGLSCMTSFVENCTFENNETGLSFSFSGGSEAGSMISNAINYNNFGLVITGNNPVAICKSNMFCNNYIYNVKNTSHYSGADLTLNCWCSSDSAYIESTIYDGKDDIEVGLVYFMPFTGDCDTITGTIHSQDTEVHELFPNPSNGIIRLKGMNQAFKYEILTNHSIVIRQGVSLNSLVDISDLTSGFYFLKVHDKDKILVKKFIKFD